MGSNSLKVLPAPGTLYTFSPPPCPFTLSGATVSTIVDHLEHIGNVCGDDVAALGSDWDGAITTPRDMKTCLELPRLVDVMLKRKWTPERITNVLGKNYLRALKLLAFELVPLRRQLFY